MKAAIAILLSAGVVAAVAVAAHSAGLASTPPTAESGCSLTSLPRPAAVGEQTLYGRIGSLARVGDGFELRFDPALHLTGSTASQAALEDTGSSDVPNDVYVRDESHALLTYRVPAGADATILTQGTCSTSTSVAQLAESVPSAGFWILVDGDTIRSVDQQYHP
jgi:hypothetical protein